MLLDNLPSGVRMTSVWAWIDIALGALIAAVYLSRLTVGRAKPEMAGPGARKNAWLLLCTGLLTIAIGMTTWAAKNHVIEWVARLAIYVIVTLILIAGIRSRRARQASQQD
jgi:hypothetical protein